MTIDKLLEWFDRVDEHGEVLGFYIPEITMNLFLVPKDRTFHHLFHSVVDLKHELETIGEEYASEDNGDQCEVPGWGLLCR